MFSCTYSNASIQISGTSWQLPRGESRRRANLVMRMTSTYAEPDVSQVSWIRSVHEALSPLLLAVT